MIESAQDNINYQSTFSGVRKAIISLIGDLKQLKEFSHRLKLEKSIPLIDDVIERVQNKSFSVAIVGEFKRGKSTFLLMLYSVKTFYLPTFYLVRQLSTALPTV